MNAYMELRHGLTRAAKIRLMSKGRKPTAQAARALVDQQLARHRAELLLEGSLGKRDEARRDVEGE